MRVSEVAEGSMCFLLGVREDTGSSKRPENGGQGRGCGEEAEEEKSVCPEAR